MFPTFFLSPPAGGVDPELVRLLLHLEDSWTDGPFTYTTDSSQYGATVYLTNASLPAFSKFGTKSWQAGGGYATITMPDYAAGEYRINNRDWCMEGWFYHGSGEFGDGLFFCVGHPDLETRFICNFGASNNVYVRSYQAWALDWQIAGTFPVNAWFHFAVVRHNGKVKMYIDGVLQGESAQDAYVCAQTAPQLEIVGSVGNQFDYPGGYIDEVRIVMGDAVYYDEFDPPTVPFPDP